MKITNMKNVAVLLTIVMLSLNGWAQLNVTINGKKVNEGEQFSYKDIQSLKVSFTNPQKVPTYAEGYLTFYCLLRDKNQKRIGDGKVSKWVEGAVAINSFLSTKVAKEFILLPSKDPGDFVYNQPYDKRQFKDLCDGLKGSINADDVTVEIGLVFNELLEIKYDGSRSYGDDAELLAPFHFKMIITEKAAPIICSPINAKFTLQDLGTLGFEKVDSTNKWKEVKNLTYEGSSAPQKISFRFDNNTYVEVANLIYTNGKSSTQNLEEFKSICEQTINVYSNVCNRNFDKAEAQKLVDKGAQSFFGISNNAIMERFDKKNNKNADKEVLWESFKLANVSGFKAVNTLKTNKCSERLPLYGGYGPADPAKRSLNGSSVVYVFINPVNPNSLLVFTYQQYSGNFDENLAKVKAAFIEKFISVLKFEK